MRAGEKIAKWSSLAGVGLKPQHVRQIVLERPPIGFFEVHAENYMGAGGPPHRHLSAICEAYPLSLHGVGLSLGGAGELDDAHLERLVELVRRYEPAFVSEHLAWSSCELGFLGDLLPIPYTAASLDRVVAHIDRIQSLLGCPILLENPSTYLSFEDSVLEEAYFIAEVAQRSGCGLLLDLTNVHVSCTNGARSIGAYLRAFPLDQVKEVHLAGHAAREDANGVTLLIDSHDRHVAESVWELYRDLVERIGPIPTLIERDAHIPVLGDLLAEAQRAENYMCGAFAGGRHAVAC